MGCVDPKYDWQVGLVQFPHVDLEISTLFSLKGH